MAKWMKYIQFPLHDTLAEPNFVAHDCGELVTRV